MASPTSSATSAEPRRGFTIWQLVIVIAIIGVLVALTGPGYDYLLEVPGMLAFGWAAFAWQNAVAMQPNWAMIATGSVCLLALGLGGHFFSRWLWTQMASQGVVAWRPRWTALGLASVLLLLVGGIAIIGITHQTAWLFTMPGPLAVVDDPFVARHLISGVLKSAGPAQDAAGEHLKRAGRLPDSAEELGIKGDELVVERNVQAARFERGGVLVIQLIEQEPFRGRTLTLTPQRQGSALSWTCKSDLQARYLPSRCRQ